MTTFRTALADLLQWLANRVRPSEGGPQPKPPV